MSDPGRYPVSSSAQRARLDECDRWLRRPGVGATVMRWLMGPQGAFVVNGPLLRLRSELGLDPTQRVLDIGCGRASVLRFLDDRVRFEREPIGLDFSEAVLALARRDEAGGRRRSALVRGGATTLPFAERAFELVLCGYVAKHLDDDGLRDLLDEIWRVLAPGGLALIWEFAPSGRARLDAWNRRWIGGRVREPHMRSSRTLLGFAERAGFPFAIDARLRPFLLPPIPRASILLGKPPEDA